MANSIFEEVRVGFRPFTPGFLPVLGAVPGWQGLITANGLGASGLTMGPDLDINDYDVRKAFGENHSQNG
ncbi:D-amino-acid dehydrogenase [Fontibacillus panacisegetis]|uniref:D-amino-acid dehydrogenase n=1 Tax=Fontibacillus panacisegetis TaxID=670482 RepID=A0A1G7E5M2_9BACL|nr:D-amino-acid dehydrogenase [Fontibacillus panacisegetis]